MTRVRIRACIALIATILTVLAFTGVADAVQLPSREAGVRTVKVVKGIGMHWSPRIVQIHKGTIVKWTAVINSHTITSNSGNWHLNKRLPQGSSVSFRFRNNGVFRFRCLIHSMIVAGRCQGMCGKVIVG